MTGKSEEERWRVWMVQARNFAKRDHHADAVARMQLVCRSIRESLERENDPANRARIARHLARAEDALAEIQAQAEKWRTAIAIRRQQTIDQAPEEMARPLPLDADQR